MQIAQVMAGYSLGEADLLRRAMGKKDKAEMARQQARFVEGAKKNDVKEKDAVFIFELVDKFAGYGFNKSHAAAYALVSYHTAYLKANFPEEFIAASMTLDMANTDKLAVFSAEARRLGIAVKTPCVNTSEVEFSVDPPSGPNAKGAIRYALAGIKSIGVAACDALVTERRSSKPYADLADFAARLPPKSINKRSLETLAAAGAFDALGSNRALVYGNGEQMLALSNRLADNAAAGTSDLFGGKADDRPGLDMKPVKAWTPMERLEKEFEAVGYFLSGHPLDAYQSALDEIGVQSSQAFITAAERGATGGRVAAIVVSARERTSQKGNKFAFAMFSDSSGQFEAIVFSDTLNQSRELLTAGTAVLVGLEAERDGETVKLRVTGIESLEAAMANIARGLVIEIDPQHAGGEEKWRAALHELRAMLSPGRGDIRLVGRAGEAVPFEIRLKGRFDTGPAAQGRLSTVAGVVSVRDC